MKMNLIVFASCTALGLSASVAYATTANDGRGYTKHAVHKHHVARYKAANAPVSDVPQESAAPQYTPDPAAVSFGHPGAGTGY